MKMFIHGGGEKLTWIWLQSETRFPSQYYRTPPPPTLKFRLWQSIGIAIVTIATHIPMGDYSCLYVWKRNWYSRVIFVLCGPGVYSRNYRAWNTLNGMSLYCRLHTVMYTITLDGKFRDTDSLNHRGYPAAVWVTIFLLSTISCCRAMVCVSVG